jgi:hypothetical protein
VTLPLVGTELWLDWLRQADRAGDPTWFYVGSPLSLFVGRQLGLVLTAVSGLLVFAVPRRHAGAWVGLLILLGAPSLHIYGFLFLLPAMLLVRREVGLLAGFLLATYLVAAEWLAVLIVAASLLASAVRPSLLEPVPSAASSVES